MLLTGEGARDTLPAESVIAWKLGTTDKGTVTDGAHEVFVEAVDIIEQADVDRLCAEGWSGNREGFGRLRGARQGVVSLLGVHGGGSSSSSSSSA